MGDADQLSAKAEKLQLSSIYQIADVPFRAFPPFGKLAWSPSGALHSELLVRLTAWTRFRLADCLIREELP